MNIITKDVLSKEHIEWKGLKCLFQSKLVGPYFILRVSIYDFSLNYVYVHVSTQKSNQEEE